MASTYTTVKYGSSGDTVKQLQTALNGKGYTLDVDGVFGVKTLGAVKDYQGKNGLDVDGIVGSHTWSSLASQVNQSAPDSDGLPTSARGALPGVSDETAAKLSEYGGGYAESAETAAAREYLNNVQSSAPSSFDSEYDEALRQLYDKIVNREDFAYDTFSDPLYGQYRQQYESSGRLAMMDTMGQASSLTGGYGSTYSQAAGQQAYGSYMTKLNDKLPELYSLALERYNSQGNGLLSQYGLAKDMYDSEYSKYRDTVSDYYSTLNSAGDAYKSQRDFDYKNQTDMLDYYSKLAYEQQEQANYQADFDKEQAYDEWYSNYMEKKAGTSGGGYSSSQPSAVSADVILSNAKSSSIPTAREYLKRMASVGYISQAQAEQLWRSGLGQSSSLY